MASFLTFCGSVISSLFIGKMAYTVSQLADPRAAQMQTILRRYMRTRNVSAKLQLRLNKFVSARMKRKSFKEVVKHESLMLECLPDMIRRDLCIEVKTPVLVC